VPQVTIETLSYGGDAVARLDDGRVAFVPYGCPGDVARIEIVADKGSFVRGTITEIVTPGSSRVPAPCPYFGACGGCSWQHVAYDAQLEAKTAAVRDALQRIGGVDGAVVRPCEPSPRQYNYRNKVELVNDPAAERLTLGYHRAGSEEVVAIDRCLLLPKALERAPKALQGALRYSGGDEGLDIMRVALRGALHTGDNEVAIWTAPSAFPRKSVATTVGSALKTSSIVRVLSKGGPAAARRIAGVEVLAGKGFWRERLGGYTYSVSAPSFFQVNTGAAEKLVAIALEALSPSGVDHVVDVYSGAGTFTLPLAEAAGFVTAIEAEGTALRDLRRNLENAQLDAEFAPGDASRALPEIDGFDLALVDPPRSGLTPEVLQALAAARPRAIAYVSCDPPTLARDVKALRTAGYALEAAWPVDLFPQTWHVETVALLRAV
jgi:23S rRNA (uracil1939-C5)-methyltransferase